VAKCCADFFVILNIRFNQNFYFDVVYPSELCQRITVIFFSQRNIVLSVPFLDTCMAYSYVDLEVVNVAVSSLGSL